MWNVKGIKHCTRVSGQHESKYFFRFLAIILKTFLLKLKQKRKKKLWFCVQEPISRRIFITFFQFFFTFLSFIFGKIQRNKNQIQKKHKSCSSVKHKSWGLVKGEISGSMSVYSKMKWMMIMNNKKRANDSKLSI